MLDLRWSVIDSFTPSAKVTVSGTLPRSALSSPTNVCSMGRSSNDLLANAFTGADTSPPESAFALIPPTSTDAPTSVVITTCSLGPHVRIASHLRPIPCVDAKPLVDVSMI